MRNIFIHIHIPKCGGSTVLDILHRNFGSSLYTTNSIFNDYQYNSTQISQIINQYPNLKCLTGHKQSLDLPFERKDLKIVAFTWIRDPIERFLSHYFFHRNHTNLVPEAKKLDLLQYTEWALSKKNQKMYINGQSKILLNGSTEKINVILKENRLLLFPLPKLQESLLILSHLYPNQFDDIKIKNKNISNKDQSIPMEFRELILPFVEDDIRLFELANKTILDNKNNIQHPCNNNLITKNLKANFLFRTADYLHRSANYLENFANRTIS